MTRVEKTLLGLLKAIYSLPKADQIKCHNMANELRSVVSDSDAGKLAFALVQTELEHQSESKS